MSLLEGNSVMTFLDEFQSAVDEAAVSGLAIPDQQLMVLLLGTLLESWRSFIFIQSNQFSTLTFPQLIGNILQEDALRTSKDAN